MKSKTKEVLSHSNVKRFVEQAYGKTSILSICELADGYFNTVYHIKLGEHLGHTVLKIGRRAECWPTGFMPKTSITSTLSPYFVDVSVQCLYPAIASAIAWPSSCVVALPPMSGVK